MECDLGVRFNGKEEVNNNNNNNNNLIYFFTRSNYRIKGYFDRETMLSISSVVHSKNPSNISSLSM